MFDWIWKIAFGKAFGKAAKAGLAVVAAPSVIGFLESHGVTVSINQEVLQASIAAGGLFIYEFARNWIASKGYKLP